MAMHPSEVRAQFPMDPPEYNGVDLSKMKPMHKAINRELLASGMDFRGVAEKYGYKSMTAFYRMARRDTSVAYRQWLGQAGRDSEIADSQELLKTLTRVIREEGFDEHVTPRGDIVIKKNDTKEQLKALELMMKSYGMLIEKKEVLKEQTIVVDIEGFDDNDSDNPDGEVIDV